jgi:COP9 signalosome complex subunit 7
VRPADTPNLPPLTPQQRHKLTLLTLLSVAGESEPLTYDYLISALSLPSSSAFESLITEAIYNGLINARLSPTSTPPVVHITSVAPLRDLRPTSLPELLKILQVWESRCRSVVGEIEGQIAGIWSHAVARKEQETRRQDIIDSAVLSADVSSEANLIAAGAGVIGRSTRSAWTKGVTSDEYKKGKGIGNKRDLDEQLEDEDSTQWGQHGGEEDGGVGVGLAKMEVDESVGVPGKATYAGRTAKRAAAKKAP